MDPEDPAAADPMMRTLRERHPDVNIVLLPQVEPITDQPSATHAQCRALQQHADTVLATLSINVEREPSTRVDYWWSQNHPEVRRWVTAASYADLGEGALPMLRSVATCSCDSAGSRDPRQTAVRGCVESRDRSS